MFSVFCFLLGISRPRASECGALACGHVRTSQPGPCLFLDLQFVMGRKGGASLVERLAAPQTGRSIQRLAEAAMRELARTSPCDIGSLVRSCKSGMKK